MTRMPRVAGITMSPAPPSRNVVDAGHPSRVKGINATRRRQMCVMPTRPQPAGRILVDGPRGTPSRHGRPSPAMTLRARPCSPDLAVPRRKPDVCPRTKETSGRHQCTRRATATAAPRAASPHAENTERRAECDIRVGTDRLVPRRQVTEAPRFLPAVDIEVPYTTSL